MSIWLVNHKGATVSFEVDDRDDALLSQYVPWNITPQGYVVHRVVTGHRKPRPTISIGRLLLGLEADKLEADHIDGDPLNNRRSNLRPATSSQQKQNQRVRVSSRSGARGVSFCEQTGRWKARVTVRGKVHWLGRFKTLDQADSAAKNARRRFFTHLHQSDMA